MIKCPQCESESFFLWKANDYELFKCSQCKVIFISSFPDDISNIYNDHYFQNWYLKYYEERKKYLKKIIEKIKNFIPEKGKVLDVGCGVGILLEVLKEKGYEILGFEISPFAIKFCKKQNFPIISGDFVNLNIREKFDLITMTDVIAHVKNPHLYVKKCKEILKKDGMLLIKTPLHSRDFLFIARILSFSGKSASVLHIPAQIYHYDKISISKLAKFYNLEITKIFYVNEFVIPEFTFLKLWKLLFEKSMIVILKNE